MGNLDHNSAQAIWKAIQAKQEVSTYPCLGGYHVRYHDGIRIHKDGSPFVDLREFKSKAKAQAFEDALVSIGYTRK